MASIRQMLSDLKENADAAPAIADVPPATEESRSPVRASDDEVDLLKARIEDTDIAGRAGKGDAGATSYDAAKLRQRHDKRAKRIQRARERRKKSGAFLTGFLLVAIVAGSMTGLYLMHPQIIAAAPETGPALTEYVATIDLYRVQLAETTSEWKAWLSERIDGLSGDDG